MIGSSSSYSAAKSNVPIVAKEIVDFILDLDSKLNLYDLEYNKLENAYLNQILESQSDDQKKHIIVFKKEGTCARSIFFK